MREVPDPRSAATVGVPAMYGELKAIAHRLRRRMQPGDTLSTTVVVHEAYTRLAGPDGVAVADDRHLLSLCARAMRYVVIDHVRERAALKRGAGVGNFALEVDDLPGIEDPAAVLELHQSLARLEALDERLVRLIELRVFAGLDPPAIAEVLGITTRTVQRDWQRAHAWLSTGLP